MEYLVIIILVIIMILLLGFSRKQKQNIEKNDKNKEMQDLFSNFCPLCESGLKKGELVKSVTYPVKPGSDGRYPGGIEKLMEVYGCPYCMMPGGSKKRTCPVCKKELPQKGYVVGRYFIVNSRNNTSGDFLEQNNDYAGNIFTGEKRKNHLHILGCTRCRRV